MTIEGTGGVPATLTHNQQEKRKNRLVHNAEVSAAEMVLRKEFAGRAKAAYLSHIRCRGDSASAEEFGGLVFFQ